MGIGRFAFTPVLPLMQADGLLTLAGGGWLASANYAGYLVGALSAPFLSSALAVRAGLAATAVLTLAMGLHAHIVFWALFRALAGVASAWVLIHVSAWSLERLAPLARPGLSGAVYAGVGIGSMVAGALCIIVLRLELAARDAWLGLGLLAAAVTVALWPLFNQEREPGVRADAPRLTKGSLRLVLCYTAFGFGYIIPATFIPALARETLRDPALYGWAWPLFGAAAAVSTIAVAPLVRTLGERRVWMGGHFLMAAAVAAPLALAGMPGIVVCALGVGATFMVITMAGLQEGRRLGGPAVLAAMTSGFAAGQIAGPAFVALLAHAGGRLEHASLAASAVLVAAACVLLPRRPQP
jgi:MFS family permease